ncbi:cadherin-related family member 3-like [Pelodytes ibericus]
MSEKTWRERDACDQVISRYRKMNTFQTAIVLSLLQGFFAAPNVTIPINVTLPENTPQNTPVAKISATALPSDSIIGSPFIVNSNPVVHPFAIIPKGPSTWELITTRSPKLNYETVPFYTLQIIVEDSKGTSSTHTIIIEVSKVNKAPIFTGTLANKGTTIAISFPADAEVYITEDTSLSTVIYKVAAKDPDNDVLQYSITTAPGNTGFHIDNTGKISTTMMFDYESNITSYMITVTISDGILSKSANIKVGITNVNDNAPTMLCVFSSITNGIVTRQTVTSGSIATLTLDEELPTGTVVTTCIASDKDLMDDPTFLLDPGNNHFSIHKETGSVIIISRMDSEAVGFVSVQSYTVKVCDTDVKCASISATATVLPINDNPPFCDQYVYSFSKPEPIAIDTVAAVLNCHDTDIPPDVLSYQHSSGPLGAHERFQQKPGQPHIVQVNKELHYDTDPVTSYEMMISVSDASALSHTVTATIIVSVMPVNNFPPVFDPITYTFEVMETSEAHHTVGRVSASDEDRPSCVRYSILNGNTDVINKFWIDPVSGDIELLTQPDFETRTSYTLTIEATDCDPINPQKAQSTVTINIKEENDEAPICEPSTYTAVIYDNTTNGVNINNFRLNCKDRDSDDSSMRFEIISGNINNHFGFDPTHGSNRPKLIVKTPFDFDNGADRQQKYNLLVNVFDDNVKTGAQGKPRTGTVEISISVLRTNTPAPPTTNYYERKGLTIVYNDVNTYKSDAWYVPFVFTLLALFLAGLAAWACHLIWKYTNIKSLCQRAIKKIPKKRVRTYHEGTKKEKVEVITERTTYEAVFDGEAIDPVTGKMYEYNTKSGARRWKSSLSREDNINLSDISTVSEAMIPLPPTTPLMPAIVQA